MVTSEDVLLMIQAKDDASSTIKGVGEEVQSLSSKAQSAMATLGSGFMQMSSATNGFLNSLTGKSATELVFGTTSKADTNNALLKMMSETDTSAKQLGDHVNEVTNSSLVSMQNLIPALNAFKSATGGTDEQIKNATQGIADFGAKVLAQTGSTELAEQAMMDLSKGIKGACASLDQYGITEDALKRTGLWNGEENDIEGYIAAVQELTGDTSELMKTNEGLDALIGKQWSKAGKKIGNTFLPVIKDVKKAFLDLDNLAGGNITAGLLAAFQGIDFANQVTQPFTEMMTGINQTAAGVKELKGLWDNVTDSIKSASDATGTLDNATEIAAGLSSKDLQDAQIMGGLGGGGIDLDDAIFQGQSRNAEKYSKHMKNNDKQLKLLEESLEAGHIDDAFYKKEMKRISEDNKKWGELFKNTGQIPDVDIDTNGVKKVTKGAEEIAESGAGLATASAGAETAAAGASSFSGAFAGFGASLGAMVAPMIMVAAAVAIMIPIVAGIVVEILVFVKLIMEVMAALNFNSVDLSGAIAGLKSFAKAMWELTSAIAAITVTALLGTIGNAITFLGGGLSNSIKQLVDEIKKIAPILSELGNIKVPGEGVVNNLKTISTTLDTLNGAVKSLAGIAWSEITGNLMTLGGKLGNFQTLLQSAITDIRAANGTLSTLDNLDTSSIENNGVGGKITNIANALKPVAEAINSLRSITDAQTTWNPLTNFIKSLESAEKDIKEAAEKLKTFGGETIADPGNDVGPKITRVANALKPVAEAIKSLRGITDAQTTWNPLTNFINSLESAKEDIKKAAEVLSTFGAETIADPGDEVGPKITRIANALKPISIAIERLKDIDQVEYESNGTISSTIEQARDDIINTAKAIDGLKDIPNVPEGLSSKITNVANALKPLKASIGVLNTTEIPPWENTEMLVNLRNGVPKISVVATVLQNLASIQDAPTGLASKVVNIANSLTPIKQAITTLNTASIPKWTNTEMLVNLRDAIAKIKTVSNILTQLNGLTAPTTVSGSLSAMGTAIGSIKTLISNLNTGGFPVANIGGLQGAVTSVKNIATELNSLSGTSVAGIGGILTSITTVLGQLKATLTASASGFYGAGRAIGSSIKVGVTAGLSGLNGVVTSAVGSAMSAGATAGATGGKNIGTKTTTGFKSTLKLADVMKTEMSYMNQAVENGINSAVSAAKGGAERVVEAFKEGINTGSPGDIAWTMYDEMWYARDFIVSEGKYLVKAATKVGKDIVSGFGNPMLDVGFNNNYSASNLGSIKTMLSTAPVKSEANNATIIINEGAVQLDARNLTTQEAKQVMITALEGLDVISNVNIREIGG